MLKKINKSITQKKLPAFTIMELIVAMLLSTICVSASFSAIKIMNTQFTNFETDSTRYTQLNDLSTLLERDFLLANNIQIQGQQILLACFDFDIIYTMEEKITRAVFLEGETPTRPTIFPFKVKEFSAALDGQNVQEGLINYLKIQFDNGERNCNIALSKLYTAQEYIQYNNEY